MCAAAAVEDNNTRVLFERVLSSGELPVDKSRLADCTRSFCGTSMVVRPFYLRSSARTQANPLYLSKKLISLHA